MTRSESFLLKVQGGELEVDRLSSSEAANADGDRGVEGGRCLDSSRHQDGGLCPKSVRLSDETQLVQDGRFRVRDITGPKFLL